MKLWQYQQKTEVFALQAGSDAALKLPHQRAPAVTTAVIATIAASSFFVPTPSLFEVATVDKWVQPQSRPVILGPAIAPLVPVTYQPEHNFLGRGESVGGRMGRISFGPLLQYKSEVDPTKFAAPAPPVYSEARFPHPLYTNQPRKGDDRSYIYESTIAFDATGTPAPYLRRWHPVVPQIVNDRPRTQHVYPSLFFVDWEVVASPVVEVELDRWEPREIIPRWDRQRLQYLSPSFFMDIEPIVSVQVDLDNWEPREIVPLFDRKRQQWASPSLFFVNSQALVVVTTMDTWDPRVSQPVMTRENLSWLSPGFSSLGVPLPDAPGVFKSGIEDVWTIPGGGAVWTVPVS